MSRVERVGGDLHMPEVLEQFFEHVKQQRRVASIVSGEELAQGVVASGALRRGEFGG